MGAPDRLVVDTGGGRRVLDVTTDTGGHVVHAVCDMGAVTFEPDRIPVAAESAFDLPAAAPGFSATGDAAGMGNPHWVFVVPDPAAVDLAGVGPVLEHDVWFPRGSTSRS